MKKYTLLFGLLFGLVSLTWAQDDGEQDEGYGPKAGDFTVELQMGRSNVITPEMMGSSSTLLPSAPGLSPNWTVGNNTPYANNISLQDNQNSLGNMIGVKGRYYITDKISTILSGGLRMDYTPGQANLPGFINSNISNGAWIPAYAAIPEQNSTLLNATLGAEYTFDAGIRRLFPYVGVHVPFYYYRTSQYDPTIYDINISNGDGTLDAIDIADGSITISRDFAGDIIGIIVDDGTTEEFIAINQGTGVSNTNLVADLGTRTGEIFGFGVQLVGGFDYYLLEGFYFGFEIRPISYVYAYAASKPGPGLELQESNTNTYSFFTQPFFKLGFKF